MITPFPFRIAAPVWLVPATPTVGEAKLPMAVFELRA